MFPNIYEEFIKFSSLSLSFAKLLLLVVSFSMDDLSGLYKLGKLEACIFVNFLDNLYELTYWQFLLRQDLMSCGSYKVDSYCHMYDRKIILLFGHICT